MSASIHSTTEVEQTSALSVTGKALVDPYIEVYNMTNSNIEVFISKYDEKGGNDGWFTVKPGQPQKWGRSKSQTVTARSLNPQYKGVTGSSVGAWVEPGSTVNVHGFFTVMDVIRS